MEWVFRGTTAESSSFDSEFNMILKTDGNTKSYINGRATLIYYVYRNANLLILAEINLNLQKLFLSKYFLPFV